MAQKLATHIRTYQRLFATEDGKTVLKDLMKRNFIKDSTFDSDPLAMAYREGARSVVLGIFNNLKVDVNQLDVFIRERENNEESY